MRTYRVSGFVFASTLEFPELVPLRAARPECRLELADRLGAVRPAWYHRWRVSGRNWLRFARTETGYLLRFPRLADFLYAPATREVRCRPRSDAPPRAVRHLFLHQVLPLVIGHEGGIVLHASAVGTRRGTVAFLGGPGEGKSTIAAALCAAGATLVADDSLRIEDVRGRPAAVPSYPALRLRSDSARALRLGRAGRATLGGAGEKVLIVPDGRRLIFSPRPSRIARVYVLVPSAPGERAQVEPISRRDALVELVAHLYRLDPAHGLREDFERLATIVARVRVARLRVPRGLAAVAALAGAVRDDLRRSSC